MSTNDKLAATFGALNYPGPKSGVDAVLNAADNLTTIANERDTLRACINDIRTWCSRPAPPTSEEILNIIRSHHLDETRMSRANVIDATHIERQREFSLRTFGRGPRTEGCLDHIARELDEIRKAPTDLSEWADVIILALDGAQRTGAEPQAIIDAVHVKQARNEARDWPDWRTQDPNKAIEHTKAEPRVCGSRYAGSFTTCARTYGHTGIHAAMGGFEWAS